MRRSRLHEDSRLQRADFKQASVAGSYGDVRRSLRKLDVAVAMGVGGSMVLSGGPRDPVLF
ncbi:MAG: hypothetical protein AB1778_10205 [Candidatus Bipolaricaulota bacterium]